MKASSNFLQQRGFKPRISLNDGKSHILTLLDDSERTIRDSAGKEIVGIEYQVLENSEEKTFFTASNTLIARLSEFEPDTQVKIKMVRRNTPQGIRTGFEVEKVKTEFPVGEEEIPIINEEDESQ